MARPSDEGRPGRLSIMAGEGALPLMVLEAARRTGWTVQFQTFVEREQVEGIECRSIDIRKPLDIVLGIRRFRATHVCMAGALQVSDGGREGFFRHFGRKAKRTPGAAGDTGISRLGKGLEIATGASLIGAHEIMPEILAEDGHIAGPRVGRSLMEDGRFALRTAVTAGKLDLGQAVVTSGRRVVAVEDIAGTDALMQRVGAFRREGLVGDGRGVLVLAKAKKPDQPMFVDLPAIGPDTIDAAEAAGIAAIFVEAGRSIVIERRAMAERADALGISVCGWVVDVGD